MLTDSDIKKFQQIYRDEFGVEISKEGAAEQGLKLVTLMSHVYKPMTEEECLKTEQRRQETKGVLIERLSKDLCSTIE